MIAASKTFPSSRDRICGCTSFVSFGGEAGLFSGTRIVATANEDYPDSYFKSDLIMTAQGAAYFPDTGEEYLSQEGGRITAAAKQGNALIIFKTNSVFALTYDFDGVDAFFPLKQLSSVIGCDMGGSVQLIDDKLIFFHSSLGGFLLISADETSERTIVPVSGNIAKRLRGMTSGELKNACSADFDRRYWLIAGGDALIWDYDLAPFSFSKSYENAQRALTWYRFSPIEGQPLVSNEMLLKTSARITGFHDKKNDFGKAFPAYWTSKAFDFGEPDMLKTISRVIVSMRTDTGADMRLSVLSESAQKLFDKQISANVFSWRNTNFAAFSWNVLSFAAAVSVKTRIKKALFAQLKLSAQPMGDLGVSDILIEYQPIKQVK